MARPIDKKNETTRALEAKRDLGEEPSGKAHPTPAAIRKQHQPRAAALRKPKATRKKPFVL